MFRFALLIFIVYALSICFVGLLLMFIFRGLDNFFVGFTFVISDRGIREFHGSGRSYPLRSVYAIKYEDVIYLLLHDNTYINSFQFTQC